MKASGLKFKRIPFLSVVNKIKEEIPNDYKILPYQIILKIPEFDRYYRTDSVTLSPADICCEEWYKAFVRRIITSIENGVYLPIIRLSDGEYQFLFGQQPLSRRYSVLKRLFLNCKRLVLQHFLSAKKFSAYTSPSVPSGLYTWSEVFSNRAKYSACLKDISAKGILGLHLTIGRQPFQEHYFPALKKWLMSNDITISLDNYVPFYFVYAAFRGSDVGRIIGGRRVLIINGATDIKKESIIRSLYELNAAEVSWVGVSNDRSLFDTVDLDHYISKVDICLVGAGIGKANVLVQAKRLSVPCIDIGYVFEVWANKDNQTKRSYMIATS